MTTMDVKLDVRHLRLLTTVAEEGSVTGAAKRLHLTQSALSHQLRDAEEKLDVELFLRINKRMVLTPAGEQLLVSARRVLEEMSRAEEQISRMNGGAAGIIRISTECYTCYHWLPSALKKFRRKFPKVEVRIDASVTSNPIAALAEGRLDVAIVSGTPQVKNVTLRPLFEDEMMVILPVGHRLADRQFIRARDLNGETLLIYPPKEESTMLQRVLLPAGVEPAEVMEVPLTEAIIHLVQSGVGIAFMAGWAVARYVEAKSLVAKPLSQRGFQRRWSAATLTGHKMPPHMTEFLNVLAEVCFCQTGETPRWIRTA